MRKGERCAEVAIIGGGPAGSAAAITLARAGVAVTLFERERYETWRIGEHLPPQAAFLLGKLGIRWDTMLNVHQKSSGRIVQWDTAVPLTEDYMSHPIGHGWFLDRRRFDRDLVAVAAQTGAKVQQGVHVTSAQRAEKGWILTLKEGDIYRTFRAAFVIEATGRSRVPGDLHNNAHRRIIDRQIAVLRRSIPQPEVCHDPWLRVEASAAGWWYHSPLPEDGAVTCYLTDADLLPAEASVQESEWGRLLAETETIAQRNPDDCPSRLRRVSACSFERITIMDEDRLTIGDAAQAADPLSGQGIVRALQMGRVGGKAVAAHLTGDRTALPEFVDRIRGEFDHYQTQRTRYYGDVRRWPRETYWFRRRTPAS